MRYLALAVDFDGTLAHESRVAAPTLEALKQLRESGRRVIMVTGRIVSSLQQAFPHLDLFDVIVAENGAVLFEPQRRKVTTLCKPPPPNFAQELTKRGVTPLESGEVIVATWEPHEHTVMQTICDLGLEMQIIFNKGAVMTLPSGVNKATGLAAALDRLKLSPRNAVAAGDAENDHAMLELCELSAAVANALPSIKEQADIVLRGDHGQGVSELIAQLIESDCADIAPRPRSGPILLGTSESGEGVALPPYLNGTLLVAGESGGGKSNLTTGIVERLAGRGYQLCIIDPEGDYDAASFAVSIGDPKRVPTHDEIEALLRSPSQSAAVNLLGLQIESRPEYFAGLMPRLEAMRAKYGRPHWLVLDEAHHLVPAQSELPQYEPAAPYNTIAVTVRPSLLSGAFIAGIQHAIALSDIAFEVVREIDPDAIRIPALPRGSAALWHRSQAAGATIFQVEPPTEALQRHRRKYATGDLAPEKSFYFRGEDGSLNLRAQNLSIFAQIAQGIDRATWLHHLRNGDIASWFKEMIGDEELASAARDAAHAAPDEGRKQVLDLIEQRYTAPA